MPLRTSRDSFSSGLAVDGIQKNSPPGVERSFERDWSEPRFDLDWSEPSFEAATRPELPVPTASPGRTDTTAESAGPYVGARGSQLAGSIHELRRSGGAAMPAALRGLFEPRFGRSFEDVRVHTNERAAELASALDAKAFTVGSDVAFGRNQFAPTSRTGQELVAHELAHVAQQEGVPSNFAEGGAQPTPPIFRSATDESAPSTGLAPESPTVAQLDTSSNDTNSTTQGGNGTVGGGPTSPSLFSGFKLPFKLPTLPPLPTTTPCTPATSLAQAKVLHAAVSISWLSFTRGVFGSQTTGLWASYLDSSAGMPRGTQSFSGSGEVVDGFTKHHRSGEAEAEVASAAAIELAKASSAGLLPAAGGTTTVPLTSVVPATTLAARVNNAADPMGLTFDSPATTIAGNIAGGIGAGGPPGNTSPDPDTRGVDGNLELALDASGTNLTITPALTFAVHDTVDFCPGALGGMLAKAETVPMSILEATEGRFGPVFAADVPFDVSYPGPGIAKTTISVTPSPPAPAPVPAPSPTPTPTPTPTPSTVYTVVAGDSLSKIARKFYHNGNLWPKIYKANVAVIGPNPNLIFPGQKLEIPP